MNTTRGFIRFQHDVRGAAAIEFAMVVPFLLVLLLGIISYGGYFWIAHSLQQVANDGARAAVAGLDAAERTSLAQASMAAAMQDYAYLSADDAQIVVDNQDQRLTVKVRYDASGSVFWAMSQFVPMPSPSIARESVVRLGGY